MHQRLQLLTALGADEGMKFVDHEELQCAKRCCNGCAFSDQQSFKRLWRDQQHPARTGEKLGLGRGADIAVPRPYRDFEVLAKTLQASELVVHKCLYRTDVNDVPIAAVIQQRSEERRVGKEGGRECGSRWE